MSEELTERFEMRLSKSDVERLDYLVKKLKYAGKSDAVRRLINSKYNTHQMLSGVKNAGK